MNKSNTHSWIQRLLAISARIIMAVMATVIASTMGPTIAPNIADGGLDMTIRLGMMGIGFVVWIGTATWLLWSVCRYLRIKLKACNSPCLF